MNIESAFADGKVRLYLSGELDHHAARTIMTEIEEKLDLLLPQDYVLDLRDVSFMDSSGIAVVMKTYRRMHAIGGRLWVENVPPQPMKVLDASGIDRLISISALMQARRRT